MKDNTDKTLVLIGLVCLFLLLMHFLPPFQVGGLTFRTVSILSDLSPHHPHATVPAAGLTTDTTGTPQKASAKKRVAEPIADYSHGTTAGMAHFYRALDLLQQGNRNGQPLRIAYFSDSYTEADILTADLRELLQAQYGGMGVGWVDAGSDVNQYRISLSITEHAITEHMAMQKDGYDAQKAGIAARYAPIAPGASLSFKARKKYLHAQTWNVVRFYAKPSASLHLSANLNGQTASQNMAPGGIREAVFQSPQPIAATTLSLHGAGTAFGTSLEGKTGIVLDNFSMRSSPGLPLGQLPDETLRAFQKLRRYDLIILAFGGNVVSPQGEANEAEWYVKKMRRVIGKFKNCFPDASIVVFGSPDFGIREGGEVVTPASIKGLIAYQRQMAEQTGVCFYNLLAAMGGYGTAGRMHEQGLVRDDLFHISPKGGRYAAERIARSLNEGFKEFKQKNKSGK